MNNQQITENLEEKYITHVKHRKIKELVETGVMTGKLDMKYINEGVFFILLVVYTKSSNLNVYNPSLADELNTYITLTKSNSNSTQKKYNLVFELEAVLKNKFGEPQLSEEETKDALALYKYVNTRKSC